MASSMKLVFSLPVAGAWARPVERTLEIMAVLAPARSLDTL